MTFRLASSMITKMQRTRNPTVCCTKKSQHQMALAWSFKKLLQAWESLGPGRLLTMYRRTVEQGENKFKIVAESFNYGEVGEFVIFEMGGDGKAVRMKIGENYTPRLK